MRSSWVAMLLSACWTSKPTTPAPTASGNVEPLLLTVDVIRWRCAVDYGGDVVTPELAVPIGRPVRLVLHSRDIDHDVALSTGAKAIVAARSTATLDFTIDRPGSYTWTCPTDLPPEGTGGPPPTTTNAIRVMGQGELDQWLAEQREAQAPTTPAGVIAFGAKLHENKGCVACHSVDGTPRVGPSWKGIWGTTVQLADGGTAVVDENYLRESMLYPQKHGRVGYPPTMPSFEGQLKDREIAALVAYIASLEPQ